MELKQGKELTFEAEGVSVVLRHRGPIPLERPEIKGKALRKLVKKQTTNASVGDNRKGTKSNRGGSLQIGMRT